MTRPYFKLLAIEISLCKGIKLHFLFACSCFFTLPFVYTFVFFQQIIFASLGPAGLYSYHVSTTVGVRINVGYKI
jgi:hypothetical protein